MSLTRQLCHVRNIFGKFTNSEKLLFKRVTRDGGGIPRPISKAVKKCPNFGENALIGVIDG